MANKTLKKKRQQKKSNKQKQKEEQERKGLQERKDRLQNEIDELLGKKPKK